MLLRGVLLSGCRGSLNGSRRQIGALPDLGPVSPLLSFSSHYFPFLDASLFLLRRAFRVSYLPRAS